MNITDAERRLLPANKINRYASILSKGFTWNPMLKYPVNEPCPCGSGKKFKKCCRDKCKRTIPKDDLPTVRDFVNKAREK